ncbi:MAG: DUF6364 family protein [Bacteroidota bacterium]|nr:DUF6364 family protein [Bacteroidota bacterium]
MDAKITLSFEQDVIHKAKAYAEAHNISLSRLTEILYRRLTANSSTSIEDIEVSDWVNMVAEGPATYNRKTPNKKEMKAAFFDKHK